MQIQLHHIPYENDAKTNPSVYLGLKQQEVGGGGCDVGVRRTHHLFSRAPKRIWKEGGKEREGRRGLRDRIGFARLPHTSNLALRVITMGSNPG